jgi:hypothetical protein
MMIKNTRFNSSRSTSIFGLNDAVVVWKEKHNVTDVSRDSPSIATDCMLLKSQAYVLYRRSLTAFGAARPNLQFRSQALSFYTHNHTL